SGPFDGHLIQALGWRLLAFSPTDFRGRKRNIDQTPGKHLPVFPVLRLPCFRRRSTSDYLVCLVRPVQAPTSTPSTIFLRAVARLYHRPLFFILVARLHRF
ncbi:hypothetical protein CGCVW01_v014425, partial [Colletotrichum viniferum]